MEKILPVNRVNPGPAEMLDKEQNVPNAEVSGKGRTYQVEMQETG